MDSPACPLLLSPQVKTWELQIAKLVLPPAKMASIFGRDELRTIWRIMTVLSTLVLIVVLFSILSVGRLLRFALIFWIFDFFGSFFWMEILYILRALLNFNLNLKSLG